MNEIFKNVKYIFSDFDGTISKYDVVHKFIHNFAKGDIDTAEKLWCEGKLSTKDCFNIQLAKIETLTPVMLEKFLDEIEIDPYFIQFYQMIKKENKELIVLSDGFDYFIEKVFKNHNLSDIKVYSNHLEMSLENGFLKFNTTCPNNNPNCLISSGCCKCGVAKKYTDCFIYIGDGLSDRCIARKAKLLFAKKSLEGYCKNENVHYIPYQTFQDIAYSLNLNGQKMKLK